MTKKNKIIIGSALGLVLIVLGVLGLVSGFSNKEIIEISGILEADTTQVPSLVSGVVKELKAKEGTEVKKGSIILTLDTTQLEIRKEQAESIVKQAEAQLEMIKNGASPQDIKQLQAKVNQAKANLQTVSSGARPEEIAQAKAKVDSLKIAYNQAEKEFESSKKLYEQDIIPQKKLDAAELAYNNAKAALTSAEEALKLLKKGAAPGQINMAQQQVAESNAALKKMLEGATKPELKAAEAQVDQSKSELKSIDQTIKDSEVKAPINGTVSEVAMNPGELVTKGSSVANVIDLEHLWVKVFVAESKIVFLKPGQSAKILPEALSGVVFPGKVTYIAEKGAFIPPGTKESVDQQVFEVKVTLDESSINNIQLRPGMSVKVKIDTSASPEKTNVARGR